MANIFLFRRNFDCRDIDESKLWYKMTTVVG